jgi:hypothetical protein
MHCEPPRGNGHPNRCPLRRRTSPKPAVGLRSRGTIECAAQPANNARARSPEKVRAARPVADRAAWRPKRARARGWEGSAVRGPRTAASSFGQSAARGSSSRRYASPSGPSSVAVVSRERSSTTAVPSSSGCASGASGWSSSRPWSASGRFRRTGDPGTNGWIDEQTSCTKPGRVSSAERVPPPNVSSASRTSTRLPARASVTAATRPFGPDPTTIAS